jgi:hypothetical protein
MWDMTNIEAFLSAMPTFKDLPTANIIIKIASKVVFLYNCLVGWELESYGLELSVIRIIIEGRVIWSVR